MIAAWERKRSLTLVSLRSAGTRSPATSRTISPTTSSSAGISFTSPARRTVMLSCISRFSCFDAFFARSSWTKRIVPLIKIIEKMITAVVAFLAKFDTRTTSVASEMIPRTKRMILNGLMKARRSSRNMVSFLLCEKLFTPYFSLINSTCDCDRPSPDISNSWYICDTSR